jgi:hypothetical protein
MNTPDQPITPISPDDARQILEAAMAPYLEDGWIVRAEHDFMARLTRGKTNMDFYVDLLGEVTREEKPISPVQDSGRLVAWALLLVSFLLAVAVASALGWI